MLAERFADFLYRRRVPLLALWIVHAFLIHYYVLGYLSWDGFGYRTGPVIELLQHGELGKDKFNDWTQLGYTPFIELFHLPFLYLFKLRGLIIGFPLVLFPLCAWGVFALVRELTGGDRRAATFGALTYVAIPMINQQPFTGYVDFAVAGGLALWLYTVLRIRSAAASTRSLVQLALATFLVTMARSQGVYIAALVFTILAYPLFCVRDGFRIRIVHRRELLLAVAMIAVGSIPAISLQIYKWIEFGTPIAPMKFQLLGLESRGGVPIATYFQYAGLGGSDLGSLLKAAFEGWVWHADWPIGAFYASRFMATGLIFLVAVLLFPVFWRSSSRIERWLLAAGLVVSLLSKDFAVPRWSYSTMIALTVILGRALATLVTSRRGQPVFWGATAIVLIHLLRPEVDLRQFRRTPSISPRMNITGSKHYRPGYDVVIYPDRKELVIIESTQFVLHLYGKKLTNQIYGTVRASELGTGCANLKPYLAAHPKVLFVDEAGYAKDCPRRCAVPFPNGYCAAWRIEPAQAP